MKRKLPLPARCEMLFTVPVTRLSMPITRWPRLSSKSVKCEPRNPAAPVTTLHGRPAGDALLFAFAMEAFSSNGHPPPIQADSGPPQPPQPPQPHECH